MSFPDQLANYVSEDIRRLECAKQIDQEREWRLRELHIGGALKSLEECRASLMKAQPFLSESAFKDHLETLRFLERNYRLYPLAIPRECEALAESALTSALCSIKARKKREALKKKREDEQRTRDFWRAYYFFHR